MGKTGASKLQEYALITGASRGIGKAFAKQLAAKGFNLLLVARSSNELEHLAAELTQRYKISVHLLVADLSQSGAAAMVAEWSKQKTSLLTVLVNNAGYGIWGKFDELDLSQQINMLQLNVNAVIELTHLLLPVLRQQKQSYILNVASTAAYQAVPTLALYAASKTFILSFSRALNYELKDTAVSVTCLSPGPTDTGFASKAGMDALADLAAKFNMQPDEVACIAIKAMFKKRVEVIPGLLNKLSAFGARHLPSRFIEKVSANIYER